uniref:Uncharacterized protein n=1 Tax=Varanus komodoensis TaxID=61221 RepID=A0A8D2LG60_VARKO
KKGRMDREGGDLLAGKSSLAAFGPVTASQPGPPHRDVVGIKAGGCLGFLAGKKWARYKGINKHNLAMARYLRNAFAINACLGFPSQSPI